MDVSMLSVSCAGCSVVVVVELGRSGSRNCCCECGCSGLLSCVPGESLPLILMFSTWLLRVACDADLKKPPLKMPAGLHTTLTVELRGLPGDLGNLSILVLANAWSSKRYVKNLFILSFPSLKADPYASPLPH